MSIDNAIAELNHEDCNTKATSPREDGYHQGLRKAVAILRRYTDAGDDAEVQAIADRYRKHLKSIETDITFRQSPYARITHRGISWDKETLSEDESVLARAYLAIRARAKPTGEADDTPVAHVCKRSTTCNCRIDAGEPKENCPVHGAGEWPPRCESCGKLMKHPKPPETEGIKHNGEALAKAHAESQADTSVVQSVDPLHQHLFDLLAIIHRDGGHRQEAVGIEQAVEEAQRAVVSLLYGWAGQSQPVDGKDGEIAVRLLEKLFGHRWDDLEDEDAVGERLYPVMEMIREVRSISVDGKAALLVKLTNLAEWFENESKVYADNAMVQHMIQWAKADQARSGAYGGAAARLRRLIEEVRAGR